MSNEFLTAQFSTLREEIKSTKMRLFSIVALGLISVPVITYLSTHDGMRYVAPMIPYLILVWTILFLSEQNALMRAGQYIREHIEPKMAGDNGWESWLEARPHTRTLDKYFHVCFVLVFFVYYFISVGYAVESLWTGEWDKGEIGWKMIAGLVTYGIGAVWMVATMLQHWRSCTTTN